MENNNINKEILRLLNNKRSLKVFLKNLPFKKANDIQNKVLEVMSEIEKEIELEKENALRKKEIISETISDLKSKGIQIDDINAFLNIKV